MLTSTHFGDTISWLQAHRSQEICIASIASPYNLSGLDVYLFGWAMILLDIPMPWTDSTDHRALYSQGQRPFIALRILELDWHTLLSTA